MKFFAQFFGFTVIVISNIGSLLWAFDYVSQAGQDQWAIEEIFNFKRNGYFVDIGASDGFSINNTYIMEKQLQWEGICIEANPSFFKNLELNRRCLKFNACLDYTNHEVDFRYDYGPYSGIIDKDTDNKVANTSSILKLQTKTLEQVLDEAKAPSVIDFLSIDVEGAEHRVFKDFPFDKYTFLAMVLERPSPELNRQLQEHGYVFVKTTFTGGGPLDSCYVHPSIPNFENIKKEPFYQIPK